MTTAILGLNLYEAAIAGFPYLLILAICAAVVFAVVVLFRIYKSLEGIKEMQAEQTQRLRNIEAVLANMTGSSNEQN